MSSAVTGAGKNCLGVLESLDFTRASLFPQFEVLEDEVARAMDLRVVSVDVFHLFQCHGLALLEGNESALELSFGGRFVGDGLAVLFALRLGLCHELHILRLSSLLVMLGFLQGTLELPSEHVHQRHDTAALLSLLLIRARECLWCFRRCHMSYNLDEAGCSFLLLWHRFRLLVKSRVVELLEPVLGLADELNRCL